MPNFAAFSGDASRGRRALGFQTAKDIPAVSGTDVLGNGSQFAPTYNKIPIAKIAGTSIRQPGIDAKMGWAVQPYDFGDLDLGDVAQKRAISGFLRYVTTTNPSGAHYRHRIANDQTSGTEARQYSTAFVDNADGIPFRAHNLAWSSLTLGATGGQNVKLIMGFLCGAVDYWGAVTQTTGAGVSTMPLVRGFCPTENLAADATDKNLRIKVISAASRTFKIDVGATSYAGPTYTGTADTWIGLPLGLSYDAADTIIGQENDKLEIYFAEAFWTDAADDDVFTVQKRRAQWTPSYPTQRVVSETECYSLFAGTGVMPLEGGWSLEITRPVAASGLSPGGRQIAAPFISGNFTTKLRINRYFVDQQLQLPIMRGEGTQWVFRMRINSLIGATTTRYGMYIAIPNAMALGQPTWSVLPGGENREEVYEFDCFSGGSLSYDGLTFTNDVTFVADDSNSNIAT